ncbi:chloroplast envelope membrane protein [Vicia villosa]|uniref:chloroplast envelope membrane protein n=1 Tax=Vicia villosa TaxID=3911 RepID=UPI00273BD5CD|nr:chloroplast envelope membrane protein [Vicia villosa]
MTSSAVLSLSNHFILFKHHHTNTNYNNNSFLSLSPPHQQPLQFSTRRRLSRSFISKAEDSRKRSTSWWHKFLADDDGNWFGLNDDMVNVEEEDVAEQPELTEDEKFEAWKQRAEAIIDLREAQEDRRNQEHRKWEDWLLEEEGDVTTSSWERGIKDYRDEMRTDSPERGIVKTVRSLVFGVEQDDVDDDMLYEDRVFQYASSNSAKFLAVLIIIPWAMDFLVHDYVLMPFLDRYVKTVPLAAQLLDVRKSQKLEIIEGLKTLKGRFELEVEIGKSPPLSDNEVWWELRNKALELRDEWRLENRRAFANIWSDAVFGISLFILLYFNKSKVALLKFTGYKIINNISDAGKALLIICVADIILGYHSETGWQTLVETILEHYGLEVDQSAITIFVCSVPVFIDGFTKLWLFKFLPKFSPKVKTILEKIRRH